jgi:hypothetical protein
MKHGKYRYNSGSAELLRKYGDIASQREVAIGCFPVN